MVESEGLRVDVRRARVGVMLFLGLSAVFLLPDFLSLGSIKPLDADVIMNGPLASPSPVPLPLSENALKWQAFASEKTIDCKCTPRCATSPSDNNIIIQDLQIVVPSVEPCHFHYLSSDEIFSALEGKWIFMTGDSDTRGMALALMSLFDQNINDPYDPLKWFGNPDIPGVRFFYMDVIISKGHNVVRKIMSGESSCNLKNMQKNDLKKLKAFRLSFCLFKTTKVLASKFPNLKALKYKPDILYINTIQWETSDEVDGQRESPSQAADAITTMISKQYDCSSNVCIWASVPSITHVSEEIDTHIYQTLTKKKSWIFLNRTATTAAIKTDERKWAMGHPLMSYNYLDWQRVLTHLVKLRSKTTPTNIECNEVLVYGSWCDTSAGNETAEFALNTNWHHRCDIQLYRQSKDCEVKALNRLRYAL